MSDAQRRYQEDRVRLQAMEQRRADRLARLWRWAEAHPESDLVTALALVNVLDVASHIDSADGYGIERNRLEDAVERLLGDEGLLQP